MSKTYQSWQDTHCDICGAKLSKRERKYDTKRCADCWEHYDIERVNYLRAKVGQLEEIMLCARVRVQRVDEMDAVREAKLRKKLEKVEAERDALKLKVAQLKLCGLAAPDKEAIRRWLDGPSGESDDPFTFWKSIVKPDTDTDA